jgi:phage repressor protein C with HTH and peptisase S24 domain
MEFKTRLQQLLDAKDGGNMTALATFCGVSPQAVQQWISLGRMPRPPRIQQIADYFGISERDLVYGENLPGTLKKASNAEAHLPSNFVRVHELDPGDPDFVEIRKVKLKLSAGISGFSIEHAEEDGLPITFRREWLIKNGYFAEDLVAIKVRGDSMEPALYAGDTVVINTADKKIKDGTVFAVNYEGEDVVKRLLRDNGDWWLQSDNADQRRYQRKLCRGAACIIIGKIVHKQSERI